LEAGYIARVAAGRWSQAWTVPVKNESDRGGSVAVTVKVPSRAGVAYAVADERGVPVVAQADDVDGDGAADEVSFIAEFDRAGEKKFTLLAGEGVELAEASGLRVAEAQAGSWVPLRTQPTYSPVLTQHSTYISPTNLDRARRMMEVLAKPVPMEEVVAPGFRLLLGRDSGLIEAMRPSGIPAQYMGSFLREFAGEEVTAGGFRKVLAGPVRARFAWDGSGRQLTVYANGTIRSEWSKTPSELQVIVGAYPYRYLRTQDGAVVRYSQMLEKKRDLPEGAALGWFGRKQASLLVQGEGMRPVGHEIWLDAGEIGWNIGVDLHEKKNTEDPYVRAARLVSETCIGGGMHVTSWKGSGGSGRLDYRIGKEGAEVLAAGLGTMDLDVASLTASSVPTLQSPAPPAAELLLAERTRRVNRLVPNAINGWELQPKRLAAHNPQPAYFAGTLVNRSAEPVKVELSLGAADWIMEASVLSDRRELVLERVDKNGNSIELKAPWFDREEKLSPAGQPVVLTVPAGTSQPVEIVVRPKEDTLGRLAVDLSASIGGNRQIFPLDVVVKPTIIFDPVYTPLGELGAEYANQTRVGPPIIYEDMFHGGGSPERDRWYEAHYRDYERQGFTVTEPHMFYNYYKDVFLDGGQGSTSGAFARLSPLEWARKVTERLNDPRWSVYRSQIYLHDEVFEQIGGYRGRWRPLWEAINLDRMITMFATNAAWFSSMEQEIEENTNYHVKLPNDVAEVFYYCGRDERLQEYAQKLTGPRIELFEEWKADPGFMVGAGTDNPRQIMSFWISTQLHVTRYESVRRQCWWLRHHGIDMLRSWAFRGSDPSAYFLYAGSIMHWIAMPGKVEGETKYLLTDRGLAWMDMKEDMDLVTLVRLLLEEEKDEAKRDRVNALAEQALDASQKDDFDQARHLYRQALDLLRPDLGYLAPDDYYTGPVQAEALPDLRALDGGFARAQRIPRISVPLTDDASKRPAPTLDGNLDNSYLEQGGTLSLQLNNGGDPAAPTTVYLARDAENLYVLFVCDEPSAAGIKSEDRARDSMDLFNDDVVEIFIKRSDQAEEFFQLAINPSGSLFDQSRGNERNDPSVPAWNAPVRVFAEKRADSWVAEAVIPWSAFGGPPAKGETWSLNFHRQRKAVPELSSWSATFGEFAVPERFGKLEFP